jgi:hypothetical protein
MHSCCFCTFLLLLHSSAAAACLLLLLRLHLPAACCYCLLLLLLPVRLCRTSLGCCDEHTDYERPQDLSNLARSDKVAGCEWSFNLLKDSSGNNETLDMLPVKGKSWIKFGPASAIW